MNYELAKELKDAGFPQFDDGRTCGGRHILGEEDYATLVYAPTLEELIEACGENDFILGKNHKGWSVQVYTKFDRTFTDDFCTPIEAVARLWLALNKKDAH